MIKGIIALFVSRIILNPMVLLGIAAGFYMMTTMEMSQIHAMFLNPHFNTGVLILAGIYTLIFKRTFYGNGKTNWGATLGGIIWSFLTFLFATIMSCLFFMMFSFDFDTNLQQIQDSQNARILDGVAKSATQAPTLPTN